MTAFVINSRTAVVALRPDLLIVLWCVWGPAGLFPGRAEVYFDTEHVFYHWGAQFAGVPTHLLPRS